LDDSVLTQGNSVGPVAVDSVLYWANFGLFVGATTIADRL